MAEETATETIAGFEVAWTPPNPVNGVSGPPDILLQGSDKKLVKAHKAILSFSTEMFSSILSMEVDVSVPNTQIDGLPLLRFDESSDTLSLVVSLFYNLPDTRTRQASLKLLHRALKMSLSWSALRVTEVLEQRTLHLLSTTPYSSREQSMTMHLYQSACTSGNTWLEVQVLPYAARAFDVGVPYGYVQALSSERCQVLYERKLRYYEGFHKIVAEAIDEIHVMDQTIRDCVDCSKEWHSTLSKRYRKWLWNVVGRLLVHPTEDERPQWGFAGLGDGEDDDNDSGQTWYDLISKEPISEECTWTVWDGMYCIMDKWHVNGTNTSLSEPPSCSARK